jgi:hypothetical protein
MSAPRRTAAIISLCALALSAAPTVSGASQVTECGQFTAYTAPDPLGPTDGSLQLGQLPVWTIAADATLTPPVETTMPTQLGGNVTCVRIDLDDDDVVTGLAIAPQGSMAGAVTYDTGSDSYLFDDRLQLPGFVLDLYPGLQALFKGSADAGTNLFITFEVDPTTAVLAALTGDAGYCGAAGIDGDGNGTIGDAIIPAALLDAGDTERLTDAGAHDACATVHAEGTLDPNTGELTLDTDVTIDLDASTVPTAPPTSITASDDATRPQPDAGWLWSVFLLAAVTLLARARRPRGESSTD